MTPIFCCGFECGIKSAATPLGLHWQSAGAGVTFDTTTVRSGARSLRVNASAAIAGANLEGGQLGSPLRTVGRIYVRWTTLPDVSTAVIWVNSTPNTGPAVYFNQSDSKLYARVDSTSGASGQSVTTGQWYRIDFDFNVVNGGNDTCDVQVDGAACGQASATGLSAGTDTVIIGNLTAATADAYFDDVVLSATAADYPIGDGFVNHFIPTSDGTHNVAGANDFERTLTGTDILNATTTAFQLVDDVPLESGASVDWINMIAPPGAGDYVKCVFGPAPGISTPTTGPRAVQIIAGIHQAGTGLGNMEIRIDDNGTKNAMYSATGVAGVTSVIYNGKQYATAINGGGAWTAGAFNGLQVEFGSPAALDVNPDQYFDCIMIEAEFAPVVGPVTHNTRSNPLGVEIGMGWRMPL